MKKTLICLITAVLVLLSLPGTAFASTISSFDTAGLSPTSSLQLMFAALQNAEAANADAQARLAIVEQTYEEQELVAGFLETARTLQSQAAAANSYTQMPSDMFAYMSENNLTYTYYNGGPAKGFAMLREEDWNSVIPLLESRFIQLQESIQRDMIYIQNFMGLYNSYAQGANTQNSSSKQTLDSIARGQSMYGDSEAGLSMTALVAGLVLGCLLTLSVQKFRRKAAKA